MRKISANWKYPFWADTPFIYIYVTTFVIYDLYLIPIIQAYLGNQFICTINWVYFILLLIIIFGICRKKWFKRYFFISRFIRINKLCVKNNDKESKIKYVESVSASWIDNKDNVTIRFYKEGTLFDKKVNDLEERLEAKLLTSLYKKNIQISHTDYIFLKKPDHRIYLSENDFLLNRSKTEIELSSRISYDISKCSHGLTVGSTGSGKTFFINSKILFYAQMGAEIFICDPKNADLSLIKFVENFPEGNVATTSNQICKILRIVNKKMDDRYEQYFNSVDSFGKTFKEFNLSPIVIFIDEYSSFVRSSDQLLIKEAKEYIYSIIMKGRQMGIFIEFILQRPDADILDGAIRDQLGCRVALDNMSKEGYKMIFGLSDIDYRNIEVKGGGYVMLNGILENPTYFETPYIDEDFNFIDVLSKFYE